MVSYDDFVKSWSQTVANGGNGGYDESGAPVKFWGASDPLQEIRRRYGVGANVSDQQLLSYVQQNGLPDPIADKAQFGGMLGDAVHGFASLADETKPVWLSAAGGAIAGGLGAGTAEGGGAVAANAGEGASYAANGNAVYNAGSIAGPTGAGGGAGGGQVYYDDYGNPLSNADGSAYSPASTTPGVGDAGAFDQFGSANSPNGTSPGNIGDNYAPPGLLDKLKGYAAQLGLTPVALMKQIQGKLAAGGAAGGAAPGGGTDTLSQIIAALGPAALGVLGSGQQTAAFQRLSDQYAGYGAPYRQRLSDLYSDPSSFLKSPEVQVPVQQASDIAAHSLSTGGNPIASGNSMQQLQDYSANQLFGRLGEEKNRLAGFGGLSTYNAAAPAAATSAINSNAGAFNSAGAGIANIFNPPQTLAQQMADFARLSQTATPQ